MKSIQGTDRPEDLPPEVALRLFRLQALPEIPIPDLLDSVLESAMSLTGADAGGAIVVPGENSQKVHWSLKATSGSSGRPQADMLAEWATHPLPHSIAEDDCGVPGVRTGSLQDSSFRLFPDSRGLARVPISVGEHSRGRLQIETLRKRTFRKSQLRSLAELGRYARITLSRLLLRDHSTANGFDIHPVGWSRAFLDLERQMELVARDSSSPALILGERGSGKELVAYGIHFFSQRRNQPFLPVNCAAFAENLVADELFGHRPGAFTGADGARPGLFRQGKGGTLFLDEIGDMPLAIQATLLRALDSGEIRQVGSDQPHRLDVRVIAATNQSLEELVDRGAFRRDLYDRLNVFPIRVPPLRERKEDLGLLADYFLRKACRANGRSRRLRDSQSCRACCGVNGRVCIDTAFYDLLAEHDFPGNVRELRNLMFRLAATVTDERLRPVHAAPHLRTTATSGDGGCEDLRLDSAIRHHIETVLERTGGNKARAARLMDLPPTTLFNKMKKLGLG